LRFGLVCSTLSFDVGPKSLWQLSYRTPRFDAHEVLLKKAAGRGMTLTGPVGPAFGRGGGISEEASR
jgi:hypothetical protein